MNDPASEPADSALHEFIDAEFSVAGVDSPVDEKALRSALESLPTIQNLLISEGKATLSYEPVRVSKAEIEQAIAKAGYRVAGVVSTPASPLVSDLFDEEKGASKTDSANP